MDKPYVISKLINNNIVFSLDASGQELILFGKGIGFGKKSGDSVRPEQVIRIFKAASSTERNYLSNLVEDIDPLYIDLATEIIDLFEQELGVQMNPIMAISLSDHISCAIQNKKDGIDVPLNIIPQISSIYPREFSIARRGLELIWKRTGVQLSHDEAGYIVLHYINSQGKSYRGDGKYRLLFQNKIVEDIEQYYHVQLDRESFYYHRFLAHLSFLAARIHDGEMLDSPDSEVYDILVGKYPGLQACVEQCAQTIRTEFSVSIHGEEKGYLALHIANMLKAKRKEGYV